MNNWLVRHQVRLAKSYYGRVVKGAAQEATHHWLKSLGASAVVAVVAVGLGAGSLWGVAAFVLVWVSIVAWFIVAIPPRIEQDWQRKEETLRVLGQRRNIGNEIRNLLNASRMGARNAREKIIEGKTSGIPVEPDPLHQEALNFARAAQDRLAWLGSQAGQSPFDGQIREIQDAVSSEACANADEAIRQLEALADVFTRQLVSGIYS